jgi:hypothetical protein
LKSCAIVNPGADFQPIAGLAECGAGFSRDNVRVPYNCSKLEARFGVKRADMLEGTFK